MQKKKTKMMEIDQLQLKEIIDSIKKIKENNDINIYNDDLKVAEEKISYLLDNSNHELKDYQSFLRAKKLFDTQIVNEEAGTFKALKKIHEYLFDGIYDYAGKIRDVNISKGNTRFASVIYIMDAIKEVEKMKQSNFEEIINKYIEMNIVHPFRDGNGRSMRIWLDMILKKELNKCVDWSLVDKYNYLSAMERSITNTLEITELLKNALTDKINDRMIFIKGIEQSYYYETSD
ncbi:cell filamentation protein [Bacilli bacterium PM5-3]|nr:cell filamentation protein [Bacilli bacterium PM5-3]MDH6604305.1 cell filamentation protein [Bacilli bacterium PM5-9]